jgi:Alcohol dehydrogenase GroES-like domain
MVSIVVHEPRALEVESASVPEPKADEVVVKVRRAGICGSDVHILHGSNPFDFRNDCEERALSDRTKISLSSQLSTSRRLPIVLVLDFSRRYSYHSQIGG